MAETFEFSAREAAKTYRKLYKKQLYENQKHFFKTRSSKLDYLGFIIAHNTLSLLEKISPFPLVLSKEERMEMNNGEGLFYQFSGKNRNFLSEDSTAKVIRNYIHDLDYNKTENLFKINSIASYLRSLENPFKGLPSKKKLEIENPLSLKEQNKSTKFLDGPIISDTSGTLNYLMLNKTVPREAAIRDVLRDLREDQQKVTMVSDIYWTKQTKIKRPEMEKALKNFRKLNGIKNSSNLPNANDLKAGFDRVPEYVVWMASVFALGKDEKAIKTYVEKLKSDYKDFIDKYNDEKVPLENLDLFLRKIESKLRWIRWSSLYSSHFDKLDDILKPICQLIDSNKIIGQNLNDKYPKQHALHILIQFNELERDILNSSPSEIAYEDSSISRSTKHDNINKHEQLRQPLSTGGSTRLPFLDNNNKQMNDNDNDINKLFSYDVVNNPGFYDQNVGKNIANPAQHVTTNSLQFQFGNGDRKAVALDKDTYQKLLLQKGNEENKSHYTLSSSKKVSSVDEGSKDTKLLSFVTSEHPRKNVSDPGTYDQLMEQILPAQYATAKDDTTLEKSRPTKHDNINKHEQLRQPSSTGGSTRLSFLDNNNKQMNDNDIYDVANNGFYDQNVGKNNANPDLHVTATSLEFQFGNGARNAVALDKDTYKKLLLQKDNEEDKSHYTLSPSTKDTLSRVEEGDRNTKLLSVVTSGEHPRANVSDPVRTYDQLMRKFLPAQQVDAKDDTTLVKSRSTKHNNKNEQHKRQISNTNNDNGVGRNNRRHRGARV